MTKRIAVGLMSGTSMDGVDAAVVEIFGSGEKTRLKPKAFLTAPYPHKLRERLLALSQGRDSTSTRVGELSSINFAVGEFFARAAIRAVRKAKLSMGKIDLIGSHGQTVYHHPRGGEPSTLQLGEPAIIAERTGVTTVADFRPADIAAGGEGAPLTPYVHYLLFRSKRRSRAIHNLGGISNLTYIPAGGALRDVVAFDTGPGNMVIDGLCRWMTKGKKNFDRGGSMARLGRIQYDLLEVFLRHPYFSQHPPKSAGRKEFGEAFISSLRKAARKRGVRPLDLLATATALTALSAEIAYWEFVLGQSYKIDEIYFTGGGRKNRALMGMLRWGITFAKVGVVEELGFDGDALEAQAFAVLANEAVEGVAGNLSDVTGARHGVVLGKIVPGRNYLHVRLGRKK